MPSSFFFLHADEHDGNHKFIKEVEEYADTQKKQVYVIDRPLVESKYTYEYKDALVVCIPKHKIIFINFGHDNDGFEDFVNDFVEDIASISDKYLYKKIIGRPRLWKSELTTAIKYHPETDVTDLIQNNKLENATQQKSCELIISLLTGSINDVNRVKDDIPDSTLDKVKQKILLFDGDQTRFVYENVTKSPIRIQGLSGTGKTELLLHKLKDIYLNTSDSRIMFTCHNRILAHNLSKRIPDFFNFMKVEQQIKWRERLWCVHAWGSQSDKNSGAYSFICDYYGLPFYSYSRQMNFDRACTLALTTLKEQGRDTYAFDYMFIDESQDFPNSFFELCGYVTKNTVYIAGDIFQSIFDENIITAVAPDYLLSKCYRTDPKTLMFAHSLGMGLFEETKLRWLDDEEWKACGYIVEKDNDQHLYRLKREPLRRFEDLEGENLDSIELIMTTQDKVESNIIDIIKKIKEENPTAQPHDIGIIFNDNSNALYSIADKLEISIPRNISWNVNKAYESKQTIADAVFVSNKNNVKGLEFPFVVCVADGISDSYSYRNALYMMLTRSFIKTYLIVYNEQRNKLLKSIKQGLEHINANGYIEAIEPSEKEKLRIKTTIKQQNIKQTYYEISTSIFEELKVKQQYRNKLMQITKEIVGECYDYEDIKEVIKFNYKRMLQK